MDKSGSNRYELLFMDDDSGAQVKPEVPIVANNEPKKKQQKPANVPNAKKNQSNKKSNVEKENKSSVPNKNETMRKPNDSDNSMVNKIKPVSGGQVFPKARSYQAELQDNGSNNSFKPQDNNDQRPQRSNFNRPSGNNEYGREQQRTRQFRDRGQSRNRGATGFRNGKREFDRQSGSDKTGVKAVDKRDGAGAHNWGSAKEDIDDINISNNDTEAVLTDKEDSGNDQTVEAVTAPEEEETKELTLDEWKALRQPRSKPQFNIRKPGEGEDTNKWKKMVVLNKKKDDGSEEEMEYDPSMYPQRVGRIQRIMDIEFNFKDGRRGGFSRGRGRGRGGARPGFDRPRFDGERGGAVTGDFNPKGFADKIKTIDVAAPQVDDERQFPTLS